MKKEEKIKLELEKYNLLYKYWSDAEKIELSILSFIFAAILIPSIKEFVFNFRRLEPYILIIEIIVMIVTAVRRLNYYSREQRKIRQKIEKLRI